MKLLIPLSFLLLTFCQTIPPYEEESERSAFSINDHPLVQNYFGNCSSDGLNSFRLRDEGREVFIGEMEWLALDKNWGIDVFDPIGQTLLKIETKNEQIRSFGAFKKFQISIDENSYLSLNNYSLPLKAEEFSCVLSKKLPKSWQEAQQESPIANYTTEWIKKEKNRTIRLKFSFNPQNYPKTLSKLCARIDEPFLFFFSKTKIKWCYDFLRKETKITMFGQLEITLKDNE